MKTKLNKQEKGFTIIEVLIVLAIAGLIILIVFLAVPALQRNSRNTQRQNDASRALSMMQETINNNNGNARVQTTPPGVFVGFSQLNNVNYNVHATAFQALGNIDNASMHIRNFSLCQDVTAGAGGSVAVAGGNNRQITLTYMVESPGNPGGTQGTATWPANNVPQCKSVN